MLPRAAFGLAMPDSWVGVREDRLDIAFPAFSPSALWGFTAPGALVVKREAEDELFARASTVERDGEERFVLGASAGERETAAGSALRNSAPSSPPRHHFTRAKRDPPLFLDRIKVNVSGKL
jgi:hypothetical protein